MTHPKALLATFVLLPLLAACPGHENVQCRDNTSCDLTAGGMCLTNAASGNQWCAYPDPNCESGYRYSDQDVGDELGGVCTPAMPRHTLTVTIHGDGAGAVTSDPAGLTCTATMCTGQFDEAAVVQLSPMATTGVFLGWSNDCSGQGACSVNMDADHSVAVMFGTPGAAIWAKQFGAIGYERAFAMTVDGDDNLIVAGEFEGMVNIGTNTLTSAGANDILVMKLATGTGDVIWAKQFGGTGRDQGLGVAVDASNNVYVSGRFEATVDFGGGDLQSAGMWDAFVMKLDSNGNYGWARRFGSGQMDSAPTVATHDNAVVIAAQQFGNVTVDSTTLTATAGYEVLVVSMAQSNGATNFAKLYGGTGSDVAQGMAIDPSGNIVFTGWFDGVGNWGGSAFQSAGNGDIFLVKVSGTNGAHLLSKAFGSANTDDGRDIAVDADGSIFVIGNFRDSISTGCTNMLTAGQSGSADVFLVKFSQAGSCTWAKNFGGTGTGSLPRFGNAVTVNSTGDVAIAGSFCDSITFGGPTFTSGSACPAHDVYAARLKGSDGTHLNSVRGGGTGVEFEYGVAQSADGRFYMTGEFTGFAEFGTQAFTAAGATDIFVLALNPL